MRCHIARERKLAGTHTHIAVRPTQQKLLSRVVLVSLGLDVLLCTSELAFVALKWGGVAYLFYLAWQFWTADVSTEIEAPEVSTLMRREFLTLMGNPKAYLLLTAFIPQFVNDGAALMPQIFVLGALYLLVEGVPRFFLRERKRPLSAATANHIKWNISLCLEGALIKVRLRNMLSLNSPDIRRSRIYFVAIIE